MAPASTAHAAFTLELIFGDSRLTPWSTSMVQTDAKYLENTEFYLKNK